MNAPVYFILLLCIVFVTIGREASADSKEIRRSFVYRSSGRLSLRLAILQPESYYLSNQYTKKSEITSNLNNSKCGQIRTVRIMLRNSVG